MQHSQDRRDRQPCRARFWAVLAVFLVGALAGAFGLYSLMRPGGQPGVTQPVAQTPNEGAGSHPGGGAVVGTGSAAEEPGGPLALAQDRGPDAAPGDRLAPRKGSSLADAPQDPLTCRQTAAMRAAERVGPAVVSITITQLQLVRSPLASGPHPLDRFFGRFFGGYEYAPVPGLGSGLIMDPRGIVVTNEHVIRGAREVTVSLPDGRTFDATVVGADRQYDLGVLRIEADDLPVAPIGDSDDVMVGEWAIALGNPFGFLLGEYQPSVTAGVISATNRDIKGEGEHTTGIYKNMIQTDASINPGNSGGPLINGAGDVIGLNTFIFSTSGGSMGIGFAIPINTVVRVTREILEYGHVRQVWIGIRVQEISGWLARYYGIDDPNGLLVSSIDDGSPADQAGIELGDIIRTVNGQSVSRAEEAQRLIFGATVGDRITLGIERDGDLWEATLELVAEPER